MQKIVDVADLLAPAIAAANVLDSATQGLNSVPKITYQRGG